MYLRSLEKRRLARYEIQVGISMDDNYLTSEVFRKAVVLGSLWEEGIKWNGME